MHEVLQRIATVFPRGLHLEVNRARHGCQIRRNTFRDEVDPYFDGLGALVKSGDWVIDVGANVGHYALRLSRLVGPSGRVVAIEPVPETFELLCANSRRAQHRNISLLNIACSNTAGLVGMMVPKRGSGMPNFYMAQIQEDAPLSVLCLPLDALEIPSAVQLLKVDAEGHDLLVLKGAETLIRRDHPAILVEGAAEELTPWLQPLGYVRQPPPAWSPNQLYIFADSLT